MNKTILASRIGFALGAMGAVAVANAATITQWNFENNSVAVNNSPAASTGAGTASSIGMNVYPTPNVGVTTDDVVLGKTSDTGSNGIADTTNTWRVRGQAGSNGAANGWSSAAPIGSQGAVFAANTAGYNNISVSFDWYSTTQGEANLQLEYSNNGGATWTNTPINIGSNSSKGLAVVTNAGADTNSVVGSYITDNLLTNGSMAGQDWFTGLTANIDDPGAANNPLFEIELVNASTGVADVSTQGTALNNSSGNWRFDNVTISGTAAPVPLPASAWLLLCGLGGVGAVSRRRKVAARR